MRRTLLIIGWVMIASLTAATVIVLNRQQADTPTTAANADLPLTDLSNETVLEMKARVVPVQSIELNFPSKGVGEGILVSEVVAREGSIVKQGDVLASLDTRDLQLRVEAAQAVLNQARAEYDRAQATANQEQLQADSAIATLQAEAEVARLRANADVAKLRADAAQARLDGRTTVAATLEVSAQAVLGAAAVFEANAKAQQEKQAAASAAAATASAAAITAAEAKVQQADTTLKREQLALDLAVLRSPIDGTVIDVNIDVGEVPNIAKPAIVVGDVSAWQVEANSLTELTVANIKPGAPVTITFDALPDLTLSGKVKYVKIVAPSSLDQASSPYTVIVAPDQVDERVRWNMAASLAIKAN